MKKLFKSIISFFFGQTDHNKETRLKIIEVINKIKDAVNSPTADLIAMAIPGRSDDKILDSIRKWLPTILRALELSNNGFVAYVAVNEAIDTLCIINDDDRAGIYRELGGSDI